MDKQAVAPFVPRLLRALVLCFKDASWPVRAGNVACDAIRVGQGCVQLVVCFKDASWPISEGRLAQPGLFWTCLEASVVWSILDMFCPAQRSVYSWPVAGCLPLPAATGQRVYLARLGRCPAQVSRLVPTQTFKCTLSVRPQPKLHVHPCSSLFLLRRCATLRAWRAAAA